MTRLYETPLEHASIVDLVRVLLYKVLSHHLTVKAAVAALVVRVAHEPLVECPLLTPLLRPAGLSGVQSH